MMQNSLCEARERFHVEIRRDIREKQLTATREEIRDITDSRKLSSLLSHIKHADIHSHTTLLSLLSQLQKLNTSTLNNTDILYFLLRIAEVTKGSNLKAHLQMNSCVNWIVNRFLSTSDTIVLENVRLLWPLLADQERITLWKNVCQIEKWSQAQKSELTLLLCSTLTSEEIVVLPNLEYLEMILQDPQQLSIESIEVVLRVLNTSFHQEVLSEQDSVFSVNCLKRLLLLSGHGILVFLSHPLFSTIKGYLQEHPTYNDLLSQRLAQLVEIIVKSPNFKDDIPDPVLFKIVGQMSRTNNKDLLRMFVRTSNSLVLSQHTQDMIRYHLVDSLMFLVFEGQVHCSIKREASMTLITMMAMCHQNQLLQLTSKGCLEVIVDILNKAETESTMSALYLIGRLIKDDTDAIWILVSKHCIPQMVQRLQKHGSPEVAEKSEQISDMLNQLVER